MQVQREPTQNMPLNQDEIIQQLQQQVTRLTAANAERHILSRLPLHLHKSTPSTADLNPSHTVTVV